jgi:hypothetical protein
MIYIALRLIQHLQDNACVHSSVSKDKQLAKFSQDDKAMAICLGFKKLNGSFSINGTKSFF